MTRLSTARITRRWLPILLACLLATPLGIGCDRHGAVVVIEREPASADGGGALGANREPPTDDPHASDSGAESDGAPRDAGSGALEEPFSLTTPSVVLVSPGTSRRMTFELVRTNELGGAVSVAFEGLPAGIYASTELLEGGVREGGLVVGVDRTMPIGARVSANLVASSPAGKASRRVTIVVCGPSLTADSAFPLGALVPASYTGIIRALPQPDGKILVVTTRVSSTTPERGRVLLARYDHSGSLDGSFGDYGLLEPALSDAGSIEGAFNLEGGNILVVSSRPSCGRQPTCEVVVSRFATSGALDGTFGEHGSITLTLGGRDTWVALKRQPVAVVEEPGGGFALVVQTNFVRDNVPGFEWMIFRLDRVGRVVLFDGNLTAVTLQPPGGALGDLLLFSRRVSLGGGEVLVLGASFESRDPEGVAHAYGIAHIGRTGRASWLQVTDVGPARVFGMRDLGNGRAHVLVSTGAPLYRPSFRVHSLVFGSQLGAPIEDWLDALDAPHEWSYYGPSLDTRGGYLVPHTVGGRRVFVRFTHDGVIDRSFGQGGFVTLPPEYDVDTLLQEPVGSYLGFSHGFRSGWVRFWE